MKKTKSGAKICPRCGWDCTQVEGTPGGPPVETHSLGQCVSPFMIEDRLFWAIDMDLPPVRVIFQELAEVQSAEFSLCDGQWEKTSDARATIATVLIDPTSVRPEHIRLVGENVLDGELDILISDLTRESVWPVIEVD